MKVKKLQDEIIIKLQDLIIMLMINMPVTAKERGMKMKKKEMENNNVVTCHLDEEGVSWKTMLQWHTNSRNKRKAQKSWYHLLFTTSTLSEYNHAKDSA